MDFNPACLINIFLAFFALALYIHGSYRFYKNKKGYLLILGLAIVIDAVTAILASLRITPTSHYFESASVPWYSLLFNVHVTLSMIGFTCFILLFLYLVFSKRKSYTDRIRKWQFHLVLPIWVIGESIALSNAIAKLFFRVRIFDLL
jgi:hypothetical protein